MSNEDALLTPPPAHQMVSHQRVFHNGDQRPDSADEEALTMEDSDNSALDWFHLLNNSTQRTPHLSVHQNTQQRHIKTTILRAGRVQYGHILYRELWERSLLEQTLENEVVHCQRCSIEWYSEFIPHLGNLRVRFFRRGAKISLSNKLNVKNSSVRRRLVRIFLQLNCSPIMAASHRVTRFWGPRGALAWLSFIKSCTPDRKSRKVEVMFSGLHIPTPVSLQDREVTGAESLTV